MADPELSPDFIEFLDSFKRQGVEFLIVGGWAVIAHGYPRTTIDYDVYIRRTKQNASLVFEALRDFFQSDPPLIQSTEDLLNSDAIQFGVPPGRIDILTRIDGVDDFQNVWESRANFPLVEGVSMISIDWLIRNKRATGRSQDIADAGQLEEIRNRRT